MTKPATAYTMQEAAQEMKVSRRQLQEIVKRHPHYYSNGHKKLFTGRNILRARFDRNE